MVAEIGLSRGESICLPVAPSVSQAWVVRLMQPRGDIPYGVAIAVGALMALPESGVVVAYIAGR